jgi:glycosyltransferase involved in cell wall biosynthesis
MIRRLGIDDRVEFLPLGSDVEFYYAVANVYVGPSLEDTFSLPPAEAMACGLLAVTTRMAGVSEIITHGEDGLILEDPADAPTWSEWLQRRSSDPDLRSRMAKAPAHCRTVHMGAQRVTDARRDG